jgi:hypothetical protein
VRAGGAVVVDDVDINDGFRIFVAETAHARSWVCEAEPIRPDDGRSNNKGMWDHFETSRLTECPTWPLNPEVMPATIGCGRPFSRLP